MKTCGRVKECAPLRHYHRSTVTHEKVHLIADYF